MTFLLKQSSYSHTLAILAVIDYVRVCDNLSAFEPTNHKYGAVVESAVLSNEVI